MKILFLSHRVPFPPNKGEKIRTYHQIKYLHEQGHDIGVLSPIAESDDHKHLAELQNLHLNLNSSMHALSMLRLPIGLIKNKPLSVANFYCNSLQKELDKTITEQYIEVIICSSSSMAEYVFKSPICQGKTGRKPPKVIMDFMDLDSDKWRQYAEQKKGPMRLIYTREAKLLSKYESIIYEQFNASFFISDEEVKLFLNGRDNNGKLSAIGNGIDTEFFQPTPIRGVNDDPILLFTGVMDYLPNEDAVEWFVNDIWPNILQAYPKATFYIAGMNPSEKVKKLAQHLGVIVTGKVDDIREYYAKADIFVAPLRLARGVQNKVLQAFACGLPVISTSAGNEGIGAKDGEEIIVGDSSEELSLLISNLIAKPELRVNIKLKAISLVERDYSWEGKLRHLNTIIKSRIV